MTDIQSLTPSFDTAKEVTRISHEKLPPMPKKINFHVPS